MNKFLVLALVVFKFASSVCAEVTHESPAATGVVAPSSTESMAPSPLLNKFDMDRLVFARFYLQQNSPAMARALKPRFEELQKLTGDERNAYGSRLMLDILVNISDEGKTLDYLKSLRKVAEKANKLPPELKDEKKANRALASIATGIDNTLQYQGLSKKTAGKVKYEQWPDMAARLHQHLDSQLASVAKNEAPGSAKLDSPEFWKLLDAEANTHATTGNVEDIKINGIESFKMRDEMFARAHKSIEILSWSFEDDETGKRYADLLIEKAKTGIDVKVMVDGQTARMEGYKDQLARMEAAGVKVVRWMSNDPLRAFDGQHRKITIVDGEEMIGGGMNFGDVYSHDRGQSKIKWRDTDIHIKGPAAIEAENLFAKLWNGQLQRPENKGKPPVDVRPVTLPAKEIATGNVRIVSQQPGENENIMKTNLLLIKAAKKEINIENAYFIGDPVIKQALKEALQRGVKVRILSNSVQSIDVPEIANPILSSINEMVGLGAQAFVKKGDTLHTKSLQVDGKAGWVGSWNMHPRSQRIEGEVIMLTRDESFNRAQQAMFEKDIRSEVATPVTKPLEIKPSPIGDIFEKYGFDLL